MYLLLDCDILKMVMDNVETYLTDMQGKRDVTKMSSRHSSGMGNLILIAQVIQCDAM